MPAPWSRKTRFRPKGQLSLAAECLRDGTLDVDLRTGEPSGMKGPIRTKPDRDGYRTFTLSRDVPRGGRLFSERTPSGRRTMRRRRQQTVVVHRLVVMKHLASERALAEGKPGTWREYVVDLPITVDVDHEDRNRANNRVDNLRLRQPLPNRQRYAMTEEEAAAAEQAEREHYQDFYPESF